MRINVRSSFGAAICLFAAGFVFTFSPCRAQSSDRNSVQDTDSSRRIEIPSSFNPVGSGARALGMGGAFIAVADDATSASWNPAGLIQLELPEVSAVGSFVHRIEDNSLSLRPEADGVQTIDTSDLNYFSVAYPFRLGGYNMIASLNYQRLYDMTRQWNFPIIEDWGPDTYQHSDVDYRQEGGLSALGLAYCVQVTPDISVGMTLNAWDDDLTPNSWDQKTWQWGYGEDYGDDYAFETYLYDKYALSGFNANFGVMWNVSASLTLGAVLKTPFDADVDHEHSRHIVIQFATPSVAEKEDRNEFIPDDEDGTLSMPLSFGIGAAYRFSDRLTVSFDIHRTEWDDFEYEDGQGRTTSPINDRPSGEAGIDPTHQVRLGGEYLFILPKYVIPVRAGLFYDPAPAEGSPDDIYGFSIGSGIAYRRYIFDMAYQYRFGSGVGGSGMEFWGVSQDLSEHTVYGSLIVHF